MVTALPDEAGLLVALVLSLIAARVLTPAAIRVAVRTGFYDYPIGYDAPVPSATTPSAVAVAHRLGTHDHPIGPSYKIHLEATPYLGGGAVLVSLSVGVLTLGGGFARFAPILGCTLFLWIVGTIDDLRPLSPVGRLCLEGLTAAVLWATGFGWSVFSHDALNLLFTVGWVVGVVNIFNVIDNMDGVATILGAVIAASTASLAVVFGDAELAALTAALCGACIGFLPYNLSSPARIFLGDGGTLPIGFVVASAVMTLPIDERLGWPALVAATLLVAVPGFNTVLVIVSRLKRGVSIWTGGTDSVTHRLRPRLGSERAVALSLGATQAALCGLAFLFV